MEDSIDRAIEGLTVLCKLCGAQTKSAGTQRCDRCWELENRISEDPQLAASILHTVTGGDWSDGKAELVAQAILELRPGWEVYHEFQAGVNVHPDPQDRACLHIWFGDANETLGGDVYLGLVEQEDAKYSVNTGLDADKSTVRQLAQAVVERTEAVVTLEDRIEKAMDEAQLAFWVAVTDAYPEAETGDLPRGDEVRFDEETERAVRAWLEANFLCTE